MNNKILFDEGSREFVLDCLGYSVDAEDFIINNKTKKRVISISGVEIKSSDLGAIKGSDLYESDLATLLQLEEDYHAQANCLPWQKDL